MQKNKEILLKNKEKIILARVFLEFKIPFIDTNFGSWSYLINSKEGIFVFDTGMRFKTLSLFVRNNLKSRICKRTFNAEKIINACKEFFPKKPIKEIIISHFHQDHSEEAPQVQKLAKKEFGIVPHIRIQKKEFKKRRYLNRKGYNLERVFREAGFKKWVFGKPVKNKEKLSDSGFEIIYLPGHTEGNIGLISHKYNIKIIGTAYSDKKTGFLMNFLTNKVNEDNEKIMKSIKYLKKISTEYTNYFFHPFIRKLF